MGPKWSRRGLRRGKGAKGTKKGARRGTPPWKNTPFGSQKEAKIHQKTCLKTWFWGHFASKMAPQSAIIGTQIDQKIASNWKNEFPLQYSKTNGFLIKTWVRDFILGAQFAQKCFKITAWSLYRFLDHFITFWVVLGTHFGAILEPKSS